MGGYVAICPSYEDTRSWWESVYFGHIEMLLLQDLRMALPFVFVSIILGKMMNDAKCLNLCWLFTLLRQILVPREVSPHAATLAQVEP
jgi:hypothetical protein